MTNQHPSPDGPGDQWAELWAVLLTARDYMTDELGRAKAAGGKAMIDMIKGDLARLDKVPSLIAAARAAPPGDQWRGMGSVPTDGTKFDVWCVDPEFPKHRGVRFTDVHMRGDGSGFGYTVHFRDEVTWQYLDARTVGAGYPAWLPVFWQPLPAPPGEANSKGSFSQEAKIPTERAAAVAMSVSADFAPEETPGGFIEWTFALPKTVEVGAGFYEVRFLRTLTADERKACWEALSRAQPNTTEGK